jgi:hypothetical protein
VEAAPPLRNPEVIAALAKASAERCGKDEHFHKVVAENERRSGWLKRKVVPLERRAFAAFRSEREEPKTEGSKPVTDQWYIDEVCRIATGYAGELKIRHLLAADGAVPPAGAQPGKGDGRVSGK